ncbi:RdgB/HAM1 family non-canonical purine NTP pyrophosphatase [Candidatus Beckwithbacteria bacterium]|nr:RdgB/HAM1 family non-canonical purine NTP pyrophosphatase [Candidatus Beckwithbacteria bacterium]
MKQLFLGTNNQNKVKELAKTLSSLGIKVISPSKLQLDFDPPETGKTFADNAWQKAVAWAKQSKLPTLVEDSGLCVDALDGQPGIHSKRFFEGSDKDKNQHVLKLLSSKVDRSAFYVCVMVFYDPNSKNKHVAEGKCYGQISQTPKGNNGFGYDPIFIPDGFELTFGQLPAQTKQKISHRAKALALMLPFLQQWSNATFLS